MDSIQFIQELNQVIFRSFVIYPNKVTDKETTEQRSIIRSKVYHTLNVFTTTIGRNRMVYRPSMLTTIINTQMIDDR